MSVPGRLGTGIGVVVALLLSLAGAAYACGPEAYLTEEELRSGRYDTTPPPWASSEPHTHDVSAPAASGGTVEPSVRSGADQRRSGASARRPSPTPRVVPQAAQPARSAAGTPTAPPAASSAPAVEPGSTTAGSSPQSSARTLADAAGGVRLRVRAPAGAAGRTAANVMRDAPAPHATARDGVDATAPPPTWLIAVAGLAAACLLVGAAAWATRRRSGGSGVTITTQLPPEPPAGEGDVEAELQEMLAEARAERLLGRSRATNSL